MILLQRADFEAAVVVLVHEAFDGGGEGGDGGGDRHAADHCLAAHLDLRLCRNRLVRQMKINKFMFAWLAAWLSGLLSTFGRSPGSQETRNRTV